MSAITSPEFVSLCRVQLRLLTQQLAESSAALYIVDISEPGSKASNYIPVVSYPEPVESWVHNFTRATNWASPRATGRLALPGTAETMTATDAATIDAAVASPGVVDLPEVDASGAEAGGKKIASPAEQAERAEQFGYGEPTGDRAQQVVADEAYFGWPDILRPDQQLVVPLVYSEMVVGLLISVRRDRAWRSEEQRHVEAVAESLAAGCVLERRNQWLQNQLARKRGLQSRQSEIFHNLLHQFRNPLTAVSTFGKLLVKRLEPEDPNQPIATGFVRESKRLRELVTHFDEAVAIGDAELTADGSVASRLPGLLPAAQALLAPTLWTADSGDLSRQNEGDEKGEGDRETCADDHVAEPPTRSTADSSSSPSSLGLGHPLTLSAQYLPDTIEPILAVADIVATEQGVDLQWQVATDTPLVWGEEEALGEVVSNLVDNAIKYSPSGARVWVQTGVSRVSEESHYQGVVVADTGPGIPQTDRSRLFERYYRGVQAHREIQGTGLGLAIAQALVGEMQGSIEVISPAVGTPWIPPCDLADHPKRSQKNSADSVGPGTAFIVWLLEVERDPSL